MVKPQKRGWDNTYRQCWQMLRGRVDVPAEVKLIDLPEGDDVDPIDVTAAHLRKNTGIMYRHNLQLLGKMLTVNKDKKKKEKKREKSHGVILTENEVELKHFQPRQRD